MDVIVVLSGDGRPIQCPTLRGVRDGLGPCGKNNQVCCLSCSRANRAKAVYITCSDSYPGFWTPNVICKSCVHYKPEYLESLSSK